MQPRSSVQATTQINAQSATAATASSQVDGMTSRVASVGLNTVTGREMASVRRRVATRTTSQSKTTTVLFFSGLQSVKLVLYIYVFTVEPYKIAWMLKYLCF